MLFVECFKSCNCSFLFSFRVGVWIPTGGQRVFSHNGEGIKKGLFFLLFPLFLPSGEEQEFLGGRTLLGTSKWGLGCSQKMGYIGFGVGWGAKYRTYKMWHRLWGWVWFFSLFIFLPPSLQNRLPWDPSELDRLGVHLIRTPDILYSRHFRIH